MPKKYIKLSKLNCIPGKNYVYVYKNIPLIQSFFPNVDISMTWKDRLLFGIPGIGAGILIILFYQR